MSASQITGPARQLPGLEWWERVAIRWHAWRQRNEARLAKWAKVRSIVMWLALAGLLAAFVLFPQFRDGMRIWLFLYVLLVAWFLVARTKTVSWRLVAGMFGVGVPWAMAIAWISTSLSGTVGRVNSAGTGTAIAALTEESLKLVPLLVLALAAPGLVRRFAIVDWLLLGFATGLAFQAFEELARRTYLEVRRPGPFDLLNEMFARLGGTDPYGPGSGYAQYGFTLLAGGSNTNLAAYAGHHIFTGLVAVGIGIGIAAWRRGRRLSRPGWMALAPLPPLALWWLVVTDHFGYNATLQASGLRWVESANASAPWIIRSTWDWAGHGFGRGWLLLGLLLLALLIDARHLRRGEARSRFLTQPPAPPLPPGPPSGASPDPAEGPPPASGGGGGVSPEPAATGVAWAPGLVADRWAARVTSSIAWRPLAALVEAACALAAYVARDIVVTVAAHARQPGESRREAMAAGRLAVLALRDLRVTAIESAAPPYGRLGRWPVRLLAGLGLILVLIAALRIAPAVAEQIGNSLTQGWLAGLFDRLADWWDGLGLGGQILVGAGIAALIVLSGGSLGLAFGISGAATYLLDKGHGLADFTRDPVAATRSYLESASPQALLLDFGEFALTFAPGNFGGAMAGRYARQFGLRNLAPRLNAGRLAAGRSVVLVDGNTMRPLSQVDLDGMIRYGDEIPWQNAPNTNRAPDLYQRRIYGDREPVISRPGDPVVRGDGLNPQYGSVGDAKYRGSSSSWYDPDSLPAGIQDKARDSVEQMLLDYKHSLDDATNPLRTLEITTNDPRVARTLSEMMRQLDVPGYVVVIP